MTNVIDEIVEERIRQVEYEGHHLSDDDELDGGQLARAAAAYCMTSFCAEADCSAMWPFKSPLASGKKPHDPNPFNPKDLRSDLIRAAALIVAELERMDRRTARGL